MPDELVVVAAFTFPAEAKLARALLESAGISTYLENECTLDARWDLAQAVGGFRLMVAPADLPLAEEVLASRVSDEQLNAQAGSDEWAHFRTYDSAVNANMARAFLEAEGIPCYLENEYSAGMGVAPTASLIVPLRLLVPASQLSLAEELYKTGSG